MNEIMSVSTVSESSDLVPAEDRVSEERLLEILERNKKERQLDPETLAELRAEYQAGDRMGERWSMQKAMSLIWTDYPDCTVSEMAFTIDTWFGKPNYGQIRARADLAKFKGMKFPCQRIDIAA